MKIKFLLLGVIFAMTGFIANAEDKASQSNDSIFINDFTMKAGDTAKVEVLFVNAIPYCAMQADFHYPTGFKAGLKSDGTPYTVVKGRGKGYYNAEDEIFEGVFSCPSSTPPGASLRIVYYQPRNNSTSMVPSATGDPILLIKIIADKDVASGVYECLIDNQRFSTGKVDDPYAHLGVNTKFYITIDGTTGVKDVNAAKEVAGVKYFNIAGMESSEPFQGMNIVVTSYTDGTQSTAKVMK